MKRQSTVVSLLANLAVYEVNKIKLRVLQTREDTYVLIDVSCSKALPYLAEISYIDRLVLEEKVKPVEDPWLHIVNRKYSPDSIYIKMRDENLKRINGLISNPCYFDKTVRGVLANYIVQMEGIAKTTVYKYCRRYWQSGFKENALLPRYDKCGGKGKKKSRNEKPLGRPNSNADITSTQMTASLEKLMNRAIKDTILSGKIINNKNGKPESTYSLQSAYNAFISLYCERDTSRIDGKHPSPESFRHFYYSRYDPALREKKKSGERHFNANLRPLTGSVRQELIGSGESYSIDSTQFDIGAADDDRLPLGRPTLYVAVDDFSSAIVGFFLVLTPPSYFNAVTALSIACGSKVEFASELGFALSDDDWPMSGKPKAIFADLGSEFKTKNIEAFTAKHGIAIKNSGAGQPDKRSIGENVFARIKSIVRSRLPGLVAASSSKKSGGKDTQLGYALTLDELRREVLKAVILLNETPLKMWDADRDYPADLPKTPNNIWKWSISNRVGCLPAVDRKNFWFSVLKEEEATVTRDMLKIGKVKYICATLSGARIKKTKKREKVGVVRDVSDASSIYIIPVDGRHEYTKCQLSGLDRRFKGMHWKDVEIQLKREKEAQRAGETNRLRLETEQSNDTKVVVENALKEKAEMIKGLTIAEQKSKLGDRAAQRLQSKNSSKLFTQHFDEEPANPKQRNEEHLTYDICADDDAFFMEDEDE